MSSAWLQEAARPAPWLGQRRSVHTSNAGTAADGTSNAQPPKQQQPQQQQEKQQQREQQAADTPPDSDAAPPAAAPAPAAAADDGKKLYLHPRMRNNEARLRALLGAAVFGRGDGRSSKIPSRKPAILAPARHQWHYCAPDYDPMAPVPQQPLPPYAPLLAYGKDYRAIFKRTRPEYNRGRYWRVWRKNMSLSDQRWRQAWEKALAQDRRRDEQVQRLAASIIRQRSWELWQLERRLRDDPRAAAAGRAAGADGQQRQQRQRRQLQQGAAA